jgi:hypothetical protein
MDVCHHRDTGMSQNARPSRGAHEPIDREIGKKGRKLAIQSRAAEIRARLKAWRRIPKPQRISLRALARELGTTHQLLGYYLGGWEKCQSKEYRHQAREIRARAEAQNRPLSQWEEAQADACDKAAMNHQIAAALDSVLHQMVRRVKAGVGLSKRDIRVVKVAAQRGFPKAQKIVESYSGSSIKE